MRKIKEESTMGSQEFLNICKAKVVVFRIDCKYGNLGSLTNP